MNITFWVSEEQSSHGIPRQGQEEAATLLIVLPTLSIAKMCITLINGEENNLFLCGIVQG